MVSTDIADAFASTRETPEKTGTPDGFFLDSVVSPLFIERAGELSSLDSR
jgi:hypothetical protein